jgi:hypothetical protein
VLNFEESRFRDLGRYEMFPVMMLTVEVFLGYDIMSFGKYCVSLKDHCVCENQELLIHLHIASSMKTSPGSVIFICIFTNTPFRITPHSIGMVCATSGTFAFSFVM